MARIAIGGFGHETNSFLPQFTDEAHFRRGGEMPKLAAGDALPEALAGGNFAGSGFIAAAQRRHTLVPLLWTHGGAGGTVRDAAFEAITGELSDRLEAALPLDALYLDLHGAMVTETIEDAEGELLARLRMVAGPDLPIVASLDYHANVTRRMVALADSLAVYRTYPHVDREQTGARAFSMLTRLLAGERTAGRALRKLPFLIPLPFQSTDSEPSASIVTGASAGGPGLVALEYAGGFPPSDIGECGPAVIAYALDQTAADEAAGALAAFATRQEAAFPIALLDPDTAVRQAMAMASRDARPVVLADTQDNPGAGGSGDTTDLLKALVRQRAEGAALAVMCDAAAAEAAHGAGEGAVIALALGGRNGPLGVTPLQASFRVLRLGSGKFRASGRTVGGRDIDLGPMALLGIGGVAVVVSSRRMQANDPQVFLHLGVEPVRQRILALKSSVHFRADFAPLAQAVVLVKCPGWHLTDPADQPYRRLRPGVRLRPLGPAFG